MPEQPPDLGLSVIAPPVAPEASSAAAPPQCSVVAGSSSSWVSWAPPRHLTAAAPAVECDIAARHGVQFGEQQGTAEAPRSLSSGSVGDSVHGAPLFRPPPAADLDNQDRRNSKPLRQNYAGMSSTGQFQGRSQSLPHPTSQLIHGDAMLGASMRSPLAAGSSTSPIRRLSGSAVTNRGGRGGRRGGHGAVLGKSSTGVIKDTTRRRVAEIARLEQELAQKLSLASDLERQNDELQRKEALLKAQVRLTSDVLWCHCTSDFMR